MQTVKSRLFEGRRGENEHRNRNTTRLREKIRLELINILFFLLNLSFSESCWLILPLYEKGGEISCQNKTKRQLNQNVI